MKYSIIIPVYNAQTTLPRCLDSIVTQKFSDYELLLINDGSKDDSDKICREYAEKYPQIRYFPKENGGVSSARNLGLEQARGEYILFVDSDDDVSPDYFAVLEEALTRTGTELLLFGYRNFGGKESEWDTGTYAETSEEAVACRGAEALRRYLFSSLWSKAFRRDIMEKHHLRFDADLTIGEDQAFIFAYAMHTSSMASIENILYHVDISDQDSLSRKRRDYLTEQLLQMHREMQSALEQSKHSPAAQRSWATALSWSFYRSAYSCCKELLKYEYPAKLRRQKIREICALYRKEAIRPLDWKCQLIALPVQLGMSGALDALIRRKG